MQRTGFLLALLLVSAACERGAERPGAPAAPSGGAAAHVSDSAAAVAPEWDLAEGRHAVYVPIYSRIYFRDEKRFVPLTATLSIRNTDPARAITVTAVRYYDTGGRFLHAYTTAPLRLGPMASHDFVVEERDTRGGSGANFIVEWMADGPVTEPVIEGVMISLVGAQGVSFTSPGRPLVRR